MPDFVDKKLQLKMAQEEFENVSKQLESLNADIERDAIIIRTMRHFDDIKTEKELRVIGGEKTTKVGFESPKRMNWLEAATDILQRENRFMSFDELWYLFGENAELVAISDKTGAGFKKSKGTVHGNFIRHAELKNSARGQFLILFKDKFGLPEWLDKTGVVLPKFLKEFMHN